MKSCMPICKRLLLLNVQARATRQPVSWATRCEKTCTNAAEGILGKCCFDGTAVAHVHWSGARKYGLDVRCLNSSRFTFVQYGPEAGKVAEDTIASAGHSVNAYTSYRNIAVRLL